MKNLSITGYHNPSGQYKDTGKEGKKSCMLHIKLRHFFRQVPILTKHSHAWKPGAETNTTLVDLPKTEDDYRSWVNQGPGGLTGIFCTSFNNNKSITAKLNWFGSFYAVWGLAQSL